MVKTPSLKFRNLTISGKVAVGSTTLFKGLKEVLSPQGWQFFSVGSFTRDYAVKHHLFPKESKNHHSATVYSDDFDRYVDNLVKTKLKQENKLAIEADLAGFFARGIPEVLKILLVCDDVLRVDRLVNRDQITVEEAKHHLKMREEENLRKWQRLYGKYDFWDNKYYDLTIDTYRHSPKETLKLVLQALGYQNKP